MTLQEQYNEEELQLIHDICCYGRYYSREDFDVRDLLSERQYDEEGNKLYSDGLKVYMTLRKLGYPGDQIGTAAAVGLGAKVYLDRRENTEGTIFDFGACLYPEGMITSDQLFAFNHDQIAEICFRGYETEEQKEV